MHSGRLWRISALSSRESPVHAIVEIVGEETSPGPQKKVVTPKHNPPHKQPEGAPGAREHALPTGSQRPGRVTARDAQIIA